MASKAEFRTGWLVKRGHRFFTWRRRFFILNVTEHTLTYYAKPVHPAYMARETPYGKVDVEGGVVTQAFFEGRTVIILTSKQRVDYLEAEEFYALQYWFQGLMAASCTVRGRPLSIDPCKVNPLFVEQICENQVYYVFGGWGPLGSSRPPPWSDIYGVGRRTVDDVVLPDENWSWVGDWGYVRGVDTDSDGWKYATVGKGGESADGWSPEPSFHHFFRQRRWTRTRRVSASHACETAASLLELYLHFVQSLCQDCIDSDRTMGLDTCIYETQRMDQLLRSFGDFVARSATTVTDEPLMALRNRHTNMRKQLTELELRLKPGLFLPLDQPSPSGSQASGVSGLTDSREKRRTWGSNPSSQTVTPLKPPTNQGPFQESLTSSVVPEPQSLEEALSRMQLEEQQARPRPFGPEYTTTPRQTHKNLTFRKYSTQQQNGF